MQNFYTDLNSATDEELMALARNPEADEAFAMNINSIIISRYIRLVELKARQMKSPRIDEDDLISEGCLGFLSAIRSYNPEKGLFKTYALVCISNKMKSALMSAAAKNYHAGDFDFRTLADELPPIDDIMIEKEDEAEFEKLLEGLLSKLEYKVVALYLSAYSYKDISKKLGISIKSVDNSLSRARMKLKEKYLHKAGQTGEFNI